MDQVKIGIAALRKRDGLTQEELGEKLGVQTRQYPAGKTVTTCRTFEMLQLLGQIFHVSLNEILAGEFL